MQYKDRAILLCITNAYTLRLAANNAEAASSKRINPSRHGNAPTTRPQVLAGLAEQHLLFLFRLRLHAIAVQLSEPVFQCITAFFDSPHFLRRCLLYDLPSKQVVCDLCQSFLFFLPNIICLDVAATGDNNQRDFRLLNIGG